MHGQCTEKRGVIDVEKISRNSFKLTYFNGIGCISAVGIYKIGEGVHLIDCNNPYDDAADRKVVEGMAKMHFFCEIPFDDPPAWVNDYKTRICEQADKLAEEAFFKGMSGGDINRFEVK